MTATLPPSHPKDQKIHLKTLVPYYASKGKAQAQGN